MRDIDRLFLILTLFNTNLGLTNSSKNDEQHRKQEEMQQHIKAIDDKLDKIMEAIKHG